MPELPDILLYVHALAPRVIGRTLARLRIVSPFVLRTFEPPVDLIEGRSVLAVSRLGKRIVLEMEGDLFVVVHLMIAGRFRWKEDDPAKSRPLAPGKKLAGLGKIGLAAFEFVQPAGSKATLSLVESSQKKRAGIWVVTRDGLAAIAKDVGLDVMTCTVAEFSAQLHAENRTLKRALTNPRWFDGIGNAYSDEILHAGHLSPIMLTSKVSDAQAEGLFAATRDVLARWTAKLQSERAGDFPGAGQVTAFRPDFAVHGKFGQPCPDCGTKVMRICYAENEVNYCPRCQTGGKVLADRSMSRLLRDDWPRTVEEWE